MFAYESRLIYMYCRNCGKPVEFEEKNCKSCGTQIENIGQSNTKVINELNEKINYAKFMPRIVSFLIDYFLIALLIVAFSRITKLDFNQILAMYILYIIYTTIFTSSNMKATIGQKIFKLKTVTINLDKLSFLTALLRSALAILFILPLFIIHLVYALFSEYSEKKQMIYDFITKTVVMKDK